MGLPRAARMALFDYIESRDKPELFMIGFATGMSAGSREKFFRVIGEAKKRGVLDKTLLQSVVQWRYRQTQRPDASMSDELTRVAAKMYVGIDADDANEPAEFRSVMVPRYALARLQKWNEVKEQRDRDLIDLRLKISLFRRRVYASRTFPSSLKAVIFERDTYTCQVCLRGRDVLKQVGLHLECDHIVPWENGGQTTYDNGQTICSDCNKAKHHAKGYLGMIAHLNTQR